MVALSVAGNATSYGWCNHVVASCIAASGFGDAYATGYNEGCSGEGVRCIALSGFGDARAASGNGSCDDAGINCIAASGTGTAWTATGSRACGGAGVHYSSASATGDAGNYHSHGRHGSLSLLGDAYGWSSWYCGDENALACSVISVGGHAEHDSRCSGQPRRCLAIGGHDALDDLLP